MESTIVFEPTERRRRAVIALFVAATFGMAAILSLPVIRLVPFPFRLPSPAEILGPPPAVVVPVPTAPASGFNPTSTEVIHRMSPVAIDDGDRRTGSNDRADDRGERDVVVAEGGEAVPAPPIHKDKVPMPPATEEHVSEEKAPATEESELGKKGSLDD